MSFPKIAILALIVLTLAGCKKTKLTGDYSNLTGTWVWINGWHDNANKNFKLEFLEKGKYKLYNGNDKIDYGRLIETESKLKFVSDKPFKKGYFYSGLACEYKILDISSDTIFIGSNECDDAPSSNYVKQK